MDYSSQYVSDHGDYRITFGWDRSMDTFYGMADDVRDTEAEEPLVWLGDAFGAYRDLEGFKVAFQQALIDVGIEGFAFSSEDLAAVKTDHANNPPGTGLMEKTDGLQEFLLDWQQNQP